MKNALQKSGWLYAVNNIISVLKFNKLNQFFFGILSVSNVLVPPQSLWNNSLFNFSQKSFNGGHV